MDRNKAIINTEQTELFRTPHQNSAHPKIIHEHKYNNIHTHTPTHALKTTPPTRTEKKKRKEKERI